MNCFKGAVSLWCQILARMRIQWDALERPVPSERSPPTRRVSSRGTRAEHFDAGMCLAQQKMELLQRSIEECRDCLATAAASPPTPSSSSTAGLVLRGGEALRAPTLLPPALLTEDALLQRDAAAASISDGTERAELHGREMRSDIAAFKAANPSACLADFLTWRKDVEGLSLEPFPQDWLEELWGAVQAQEASSQQGKLFEPYREAEMALHYLENIEGTQLLLQLFRVLLRDALEELSARIAAVGDGPPHLRSLRDRALAAALSAFSKRGAVASEAGEVDAEAVFVGEVAQFPDEDALQNILTSPEALESATCLTGSLLAKLPGQAEVLLDELLTQGEADVASNLQRCTVERLFEKSRMLDRDLIDEETEDADQGVFDSLPLAKEFVLQLQPVSEERCSSASARRLYAEVRKDHMRLALVRGLRVG
eukprot:TRINITY_DN68934_c0_g1_i1.p1 TRINITY_DN68934_c0_g1~~TRINITY_DN68934_c0_g1_i1.p1  ORF type:complete len:447 (+),score=113.57 TRINITY_DN68934_c0_g1_i1:61-1341(+)